MVLLVQVFLKWHGNYNGNDNYVLFMFSLPVSMQQVFFSFTDYLQNVSKKTEVE